MVAAPGTTPTGVNFEARPNFKVAIDPVDVPEEGLLQVTNLPGIKQTGYVNGRAYYGAVYIEGGLKFAGFFATVGEPVLGSAGPGGGCGYPLPGSSTTTSVTVPLPPTSTGHGGGMSSAEIPMGLSSHDLDLPVPLVPL